MFNQPIDVPKGNEGRLNAKVVKELNRFEGVKAVKHHGSVFTHAGHPDVYGTVMGLAFFIEGKMPGGKLSVHQERELAEWKAAGAITGVYYSVEEALEIVWEGCRKKYGFSPCLRAKVEAGSS